MRSLSTIQTSPYDHVSVPVLTKLINNHMDASLRTDIGPTQRDLHVERIIAIARVLDSRDEVST